jgi:hypothetical protein
MTTQLTIYNDVLTQKLGETKLASLSENREPRRILDDIWDSGNGAPKYCLELGQWKFAEKRAKLTGVANTDDALAYRFYYAKPADFVSINIMADDNTYNSPLIDNQYIYSNDKFYSDFDYLFIAYVSNHASYGMDLAKWPPSFVDLVQLRMAYLACNRIVNSGTDKEAIYKQWQEAEKIAKNQDFRHMPTRYPRSGSWVRARRTGRYVDRVSGSTLY